MTRSARFWDRIAARYARSPISDPATYARKLEATRRYLAPAHEVLEIGCGTGSTALEHAPRVRHLHAIDYSGRMIEIAERKRVAAGIDNVTFECRALEDLDPAAQRYDVILALNVLHLLPQWRATLPRLAALLEPGGVLVSSTACLGDGMGWVRYVAPLGSALRLIPAIAVMTAAELEDGLRAAGLEIVEQWSPGRNKALFTVARKVPPPD